MSGVSLGPGALTSTDPALRSYLWLRVLFGIQPIALLLTIIKSAAFIIRMKYFEADISWECTHGYQGQASPGYAANSRSS